ncbi:Pentatricopeptide repeat-containing protein [Thalictrum thalictroides]|uniref:Pentatricopeptide repeat-containing protein n=1 Tax=Thalictrum thalictroides TaxID=46969 RepID=A0A7J6VR38_THATH|nr:Pentatricopeptide repeat-containing protein [Thalictrum thalictroides]
MPLHLLLPTTTLPSNTLLSSSSSTSFSLLRNCSSPKEIQQIHAQSIKLGHFYQYPLLPIKLISSWCSLFQSSCSSSPNSIEQVHYALSLFNQTTHYSSSFIYNTLIRAFNQVNQPQQAILLFYRMLHDPFGVIPDKFTYPFVLKSCSQLFAIEEGEQIHCLALKTGFVFDLFVENCLIHMYSRCGKIDSVCKVFKGISNGNDVTWNSMIDAFVKAGDIGSARRVFDEMPERNIVSWNSMIAGYARESLFDEALDLYIELQVLGLCPDETTMMSIISVVSDLGLLSLGKKIHGYVIRNEFSLNGGLGAALIDMYSKCGSIYSALQVFEDIPNKNVGHWTSMIVGFSVHGCAEVSLHLFAQMQKCGVKPNYVTFIGVLSACSHGGLVEQGIKHFNLMKMYNIEPRIQHYGCLVDLLGRSGFVKEAKMVIDNMPMAPNAVMWSALLAACRNHGDAEIGEIAAQKLLELTPEYGGGYVLLSNLYANSCKWVKFGSTRRMMGGRGVEKVSGISWIEVDGEINEFLVGEKFHPRSLEMYKLLDEIQCKLSWEEL